MPARTFTFSVVAPPSGTTKAAQIASAMTAARPSAPMWSSELTDANLQYIARTTIDQNVGNLGTMTGAQAPAFVAPTSGGVDLLAWTGKAHYYGGKWYYVAGTSGNIFPWSVAVVVYDPAIDEFRHWTGSAIGAADGPFYPHACPHNFQGAALDPNTGKIYRHLSYAAGTPGPNMGVWDIGTSSGTRIAGSPADGGSYYPAIENHQAMGAAGTLLMFIHDGTRTLKTFDIASQTWTGATSWSVAMPALVCPVYHDGYVYFAAGASTREFWRVTPAGALEARAATPVVMNSGGSTYGNHTIMVSLGAYIYAFHNSSGVYRYDPATNSWSGVYDTWPYSTDDRFAAGPLTDIGCVLVVRSVNGLSRQAQLWKP